MLRSTLELTYPIVTLTSGDVSPDSRYCKVGGFFTAYFFEASDLMVFIIAIHTAVYVFNPKLTQAADDGGLWRWRYYVFATWFIIPGLLAGLAFINPTPYVPLVTWCYLPARPLVWRYTLAWGPRYFILLTISVLYVALYIYVRRVYHRIDRNQRGSSVDSEFDSQTSSNGDSHAVEPTQSNLQFPAASHLQRPRPSIPLPLLEDPEKESRQSMRTSNETPTTTSETSISHQNFLHYEKPNVPPAATTRNMSAATTLTDALPTSMRNPSCTPRDLNGSFSQRRARVERHMRTLFIFPIVYFIMWIPPFINHLYQVITYNSNAKSLPPGTFVVTVIATVFLPAQGFVNVCVYAVRERPWRRRKRNPRTATPKRSSFRPAAFVEWKGFHRHNNNPAASGEPLSNFEIQAQLDQAKENHLRTSNPLEAAYIRREIEQRERELSRVQTTNFSEQRPKRSNWWDAQYDIENKV